MTPEKMYGILLDVIDVQISPSDINKGIQELYWTQESGNTISIGVSYEWYPESNDADLREPHYYVNLFLDNKYIDAGGAITKAELHKQKEIHPVIQKLVREWDTIEREIEQGRK